MTNCKSIKNVLSNIITGEWGEKPNLDRIKVIRTTNFTNEGKLDLTDVAERDIPKEIVKRKKLKYGDIILEKSGGSDNFAVGRVVFFNLKKNEDYLCNNFTQILRANEKLINSRYLFYYLWNLHKKGLTENLQNKTTGIRNLQVERYLSQTIPLPKLEIQKNIAALLDKAESVREKRKEANRLTDEFLKSTFMELFGDPIRNNKKWQKKSLGEIVEIKRNIIDPSQIKNDTKYIGLEHIEKDTGVILKYELINNNDIKSSKFNFTSECVLLGKLRPYLNKVALPDFSGICSTDILPIIPKEGIANRYFIAFILRHNSFVNYATGISAGANLPRISPDDIIAFKTIITPIKLQNKFASIVQKTEKLKSKQQGSEEELDNLFNSLMQKSFSG